MTWQPSDPDAWNGEEDLQRKIERINAEMFEAFEQFAERIRLLPEPIRFTLGTLPEPSTLSEDVVRKIIEKLEKLDRKPPDPD